LHPFHPVATQNSLQKVSILTFFFNLFIRNIVEHSTEFVKDRYQEIKNMLWGAYLSGYIYVVDDDPILLDLMSQVLDLEGYTNIRAFTNPISVFKEIVRFGCPRLIITDMNMPEITGVDLLHNVSGIYPKVKGIIVTANPAAIEHDSVQYPVLDKAAHGFTDKLGHTVKMLAI
jgi:CheY-like chemotaxis protein